MESLINTGDQYQRYRQIVHFQTTPKLFILDAKRDLFKDLPSEELGNVMKEIIKMDAEKSDAPTFGRLNVHARLCLATAGGTKC